MHSSPSFSYERRPLKKKGPLKQKPFAVVRFTAYDDFYDEPLKVKEDSFPDTKKGHSQFQGKIIAALEAGFDVSVVTSYPIENLIELLDFITLE